MATLSNVVCLVIHRNVIHRFIVQALQNPPLCSSTFKAFVGWLRTVSQKSFFPLLVPDITHHVGREVIRTRNFLNCLHFENQETFTFVLTKDKFGNNSSEGRCDQGRFVTEPCILPPLHKVYLSLWEERKSQPRNWQRKQDFTAGG